MNCENFKKFIDLFKDKHNPENVLLFNEARYSPLFDELKQRLNPNLVITKEYDQNYKISSESVSITGNPKEVALEEVTSEIKSTFKLIINISTWSKKQKEIRNIFSRLKLLSQLLEDQGVIFLITEKICLLTCENLVNSLSYEGLYLNAAFNLKENWRDNVVLLICKNKRDKTFLAQIKDDSDVATIFNNFLNSIDSKNIDNGTLVDPSSFFGFEIYEKNKEIKKFCSDNPRFRPMAGVIYGHKTDSSAPSEGEICFPLNTSPLAYLNKGYLSIYSRNKNVPLEYLDIFFSGNLGKYLLSL